MDDFDLVTPGPTHLRSYVAALRSGWSPNTTRPEVADVELVEIEADPVAFLANKTDLAGTAPPIALPDGTTRPRLPGFTRWMWDGDFCGSINFRWQPGTTDLPPHVLGHVGYTVVPWKRRRGYATAALGLLLQDLGGFGLPFIELTTDDDNLASQKVIEAHGGVLHDRFEFVPGTGDLSGLRYRIPLAPG